jgi:hypothetical protein
MQAGQPIEAGARGPKRCVETGQHMRGLPVSVAAALQSTAVIHRMEERRVHERTLVDDNRCRAATRRIDAYGTETDAARAGGVLVRQHARRLRQRGSTAAPQRQEKACR